MKKNPKSEIRNQKSGIDIDHVAKLADLSLSKSEKTVFEKQLGNILAYFNKLGDLKTKKVAPISQITGLENVTRSDKTTPSLSYEDALANTKRRHNGFFEVDSIFEENGPE